MGWSGVARLGLPALLLLGACATAPAKSATGQATAIPHAGGCTQRADYAGPTPLKAPLPDFEDPFDVGQSVPAPVAARLEAAFADARSHIDAKAVAVSLWQPENGYWSRRDGIDQATPMWLASVGKLVTGAVVLQLVEEGKLALDQTLEPWFPGLQGADQITVDDLLRHTSGLFSFNGDRELREGPPTYRDPDTLLAIAERHPRDFCPGSNWNYSNTGYVLLARIAEKVTGESFGALVEQRVAGPLHLDTLRVLDPDDPPTAMHGSSIDRPATVASVAGVYGAGGLVATSDDALALLHAYLSGKLIQRTTLQEAASEVIPMFGQPMAYGRGLMVIEVPDPQAPSYWVGHLGGAPSAKAVVVYDDLREAYMAVLLDADGPAEALANALFKALDGDDSPP